MEKTDLSGYTKGWFIGDFEPSLFQTKDFEVAIKEYEKGVIEDAHYHKEAVEFTVVLDGKVKMNDTILTRNEVMRVDKNDISKFECLEDARLLVIKTPSVKGDKYIAE